MISGIYAIRNAVTGHIYVGSSVNTTKRTNAHRRLLRKDNHPNQRLQRAWNKYGEGAFVFELIEAANVDMLIAREQFHIDRVRREGMLYNLRPIASSNLGLKHDVITPAMREQRRQIHLGKPKAEEIKAKISATLSGRKVGPYSKDRRANLSAGLKGHRVSQEARQNMSVAAKRRGMPPRTAEMNAKLAASQRAAWISRRERFGPAGRAV
jgi:group I intron endonuclease